ncbi:hypothetical protein SUGI_0737010 [Cryptomeria japonica]|uniref:COP9 signalosome complex subunit 3 n=1 Tax=Cryptomeria japonica TaxID=3369 RepID=UPI002414BC30|nr:COP9 signalosome complex subunit 3 [Cryptomeria japonica]GLJ36631.1 hypothetical protein SUGI_0737010 [Cryptomeria japonica]
MDPLDALIAQVQGFSDSNADVTHLHGLLKEFDAQSPLHELPSARLSHLLSQLDPVKHSLGYLYVLEAQSSGSIPREQAEAFLLTASNFINSCLAEQIRIAPEKFTTFCRRFKEQAMDLQLPKQTIIPLRTAIRKLQPSSEHLTSLHPDFLLMCLLAKCYKAGLSILEDDIFEIDQPRDFLLYCYYGGMVYIGLKHFSKALEFLQHAITAPTTVLTAITVEAYKKYLLVSLIHTGQVPSFPKYTPAVVQRNLKSCTQSYIELANNYTSGKISVLESCLNMHMEKFKNDSNLGLVKQVLSSLYKRNIQRLTQTYLTLSLQDIANTVQLETAKQAELHVLQMIQDGEIFATINQKDGMVSFQEDPEQYKTCKMTEHIDSAIRRIMALSRKLTSIDEQVSCDHAYLSKVGRERSRFDIDDFDTVPQKFPNM